MRYLFVMPFIFTFSLPVSAESYVLGKYSNFNKESGYVVYSQTEFLKASQWLRAESSSFSRAQKLAQTEWYKEHDKEGYPGKLAKPRTLKRYKTFPSKEKAESEMERLNAKAERWEERKNKDHKEEMPRFIGRDAKRQKQSWLAEQKELQEIKDKREQKKDDQAARLEAVIPYIEKQLAELVKKQPGMDKLEAPTF